MKGFESKNVEVSSNTEFKGIDMTIDSANVGFIFDIMFKQMYRDPIGSLIREITSNAFDAHIEAGVKDAVVIKLAFDDGGYYIEFKDVGVGISEDRMENIYAKPASSTKRGSNDQIGYWGLGSKSPLAYDDSFQVNTIFNNTKYEYVVHKGTKGPRIELFDKSETTERNGTTVRINIKDNDVWTFEDKIKTQLRYFDNVYVIGRYSNFNNDYKIYEGETFKFRNDSALTDELHICIGKVVYPIDWGKLKRERIKLPFGLKFNIGDLPITPERESIRYVSIEKDDGSFVETTEIINTKIDAMLNEVYSLEVNIPTDHNNLVDYYTKQEDKPYIELLGIRIDLSELSEKRKHHFVPFFEVGLELPTNPFYQYEITKLVFRGKLRKVDPDVRKRLDVNTILKGTVIRDFTNTGRFKQVLIDYLYQKAEREGKLPLVFINKRNMNIREISHLTFPPDLDLAKTNRLKLWKLFDATMAKEVIFNSEDVANIVIPAEYITRWKKMNPSRSTSFEIKDDEIKVENMKIPGKTNRTRAVVVEHLRDFKGFILYGFNKDEVTLENYAKLFSSGVYEKQSKIYKISTRDEKHLVKLPNTIYVHSFMSNNPVFKKVATALRIRKSPIWKKGFLLGISHNGINDLVMSIPILDLIFTPLATKVKELDEVSQQTAFYATTVGAGSEDFKEFTNEIVDIAEKNNWLEENIEKDIKRVENYLNGLNLMTFIKAEEEAIPYIAEFFSLKGKKVNPIWTSLFPYELEMVREAVAKTNYMGSLPLESFHRHSAYRTKLERKLEYFKTSGKQMNTLLNYYDSKKAISN